LLSLITICLKQGYCDAEATCESHHMSKGNIPVSTVRPAEGLATSRLVRRLSCEAKCSSTSGSRAEDRLQQQQQQQHHQGSSDRHTHSLMPSAVHRW
jgi:hypothetical protein